MVIDSLGVGAMEDSPEFGDVDVNTLGHISRSVDSFVIPNLQKMGMANLTPLKQVEPVKNSLGYYGKLREKSILLFGVSQSTFDGAMHGHTEEEYTKKEVEAIINEWLYGKEGKK